MYGGETEVETWAINTSLHGVDGVRFMQPLPLQLLASFYQGPLNKFL